MQILDFQHSQTIKRSPLGQRNGLIKLEAQWVEPVSLTFHSDFRKLYTEPSICASYHILVYLTTRFQKRFF